MTALEKLITLKKTLDRNLSTRSGDILPIINEVISMLQQNEEIKTEKPVKTVVEIKQKEAKEPKAVITLEVKEDVNEITEPTEPTEPKEDNTAERAMEYLKSIKAKGLHLYKDSQKIIDKAVKEWFVLIHIDNE